MEKSSDYQNHISIVKQLKPHSDSIKVREPYKEDFEKIYEKAESEDVKVSNAKEFLETLSSEELDTLQEYARLVNDINIDDLSDEGAYNLLMHSYEKYDFNDDGIVENGIGRNIPMIPQNMDSDTKQAYVNTLNSLDEKDRFMMGMVLSLDVGRIKYDIAQHFAEMSESQIAYLQQYANFDIDRFVEETLSEPYHPQPTTYESIQKRIDSILNPPPGGYSSPELKSSASKFKEAFQNEYQKIKQNKALEADTALVLSRQKGGSTAKAQNESPVQNVLKAV